jgi:hypothetical protein
MVFIIIFTTSMGNIRRGSPLLSHLHAQGRVTPLGGPLFALAHYQTLLKTIARAPNCVFLSLTNDTHIMGPMNEIVLAFDHLSIQLAIVGHKVKVSKCKLWSLLGNFSSIKIL